MSFTNNVKRKCVYFYDCLYEYLLLDDFSCVLYQGRDNVDKIPHYYRFYIFLLYGILTSSSLLDKINSSTGSYNNECTNKKYTMNHIQMGIQWISMIFRFIRNQFLIQCIVDASKQKSSTLFSSHNLPSQYHFLSRERETLFLSVCILISLFPLYLIRIMKAFIFQYISFLPRHNSG